LSFHFQRFVIARSKATWQSKKDFVNWGINVKISTDDGSAGFKGKVTELLRHLLPGIEQRASSIYACGPKPMLKEISIISKKYNMPAQICLDEYMACGLGVCLGCMIQTKQGQRFVCKDGPVFETSELSW